MRWVCIAMVLCVGLASPGRSAGTTEVAWVKMESGTTQALHGVWVFADDAAVAVGKEGVVLWFDGATWSTMATPEEKPDCLNAV